MRKFSDEWYEWGKNPLPHLKRYWYLQYVKAHPDEFGFKHLEGLSETRSDFRGALQGEWLTVGVDRDYLSYRYRGHHDIDVLIVGVLDPPLPVMVPFLPPIIKNLDPQKVLDWSEPKRANYREQMDKRRALLPEQQEWVMENLHRIRGFRVTKDERLEVVMRDQSGCKCGGVMLSGGYRPELDGELTEGQLADYYGGFWKVFECRECGIRRWVASEGGDIPGEYE